MEQLWQCAIDKTGAGNFVMNIVPRVNLENVKSNERTMIFQPRLSFLPRLSRPVSLLLR